MLPNSVIAVFATATLLSPIFVRCQLSTAIEPKLGPKEFYDGEHFYLSVKKPLTLYVYDETVGTKKPTAISLNEPAKSIKGSETSVNPNQTTFAVNIKWESDSPPGFQSEGEEAAGGTRIKSLILKMFFTKQRKEFSLTKISVLQVHVDNDVVDSSELRTVDSDGTEIRAPIGMTFACSSVNQLKPKDKEDRMSRYKFGIGFTDVKIRVFNVPSAKASTLWQCGVLIPIGLWVGLLLSFGFAFVCIWGFSMLGSIRTMDKFDDAKSKGVLATQSGHFD